MALTVKTFAAVSDALPALQAVGARYLGGGTLLVRRVNEGDISISTLVRVSGPSLSRIAVSDGRAIIGASATMAAVARHPDLAFLRPAAHAIGGPAVRNMATVGGNIFAPAPYGDFAVALLALDAAAEIAGKPITLADLIEHRKQNGGRIVTAVSLALPKPGAFRFVKITRVKPNGLAVLTIAAVIEERDGVVSAIRIALGNMADRPIRARAAEAALVGRPLTREGIRPALAVAGDGTAPADDAVASAWYRREVLPVHLGRLLLAKG
ncbi:MAG TPA: FAD binding domain-containing protein [Roseiarcus sp.]|nr:FAD binding domain-containing protein [Roseiarcus sp.]